MKNTPVLFSLGVAIFLVGFGLGYFFDHLPGDGFFLLRKSTASLSSSGIEIVKTSPSPKIVKKTTSTVKTPTSSKALSKEFAVSVEVSPELVENSPQPSPSIMLVSSPAVTPLISSSPEPNYETNPSSKVLISEVQITGAVDEKEDFVELYNANDKEVDLTDWYLQRKTKTGSAYATFASKTLFANKKIPSHGYFLIARSGYFGTLADIVVNNPLTEDNSLVLKNPDGEIVDKVGWGSATDYGYSPAVNPLKGQTIGRKVVAHVEQDSLNNSVDFELNESTPRVENKKYIALASYVATLSLTPTPTVTPLPSLSPSPTPEPSPSVEPEISPSPSPTVESTPDMTPSPEASPEISPTVSPEISPTPSPSLEPTLFPLESPAPSPSPTPLMSIVINEIKTYGVDSSDQFVELYNPNLSDIDLAGYALKKKSSTGTESNLVSAGSFSGIISALGFFLIAPQNYSGSGISNLYYSGTSFSIAQNNNTVLLYDSGEILIDKVGFGAAKDFENSAFLCSGEAQCIPKGKSMERQIPGLDSQNNAEDFKLLEIPTPGT